MSLAAEVWCVLALPAALFAGWLARRVPGSVSLRALFPALPAGRAKLRVPGRGESTAHVRRRFEPGTRASARLPFSGRLSRWRGVLFGLGTLLVLLALARPMWGERTEVRFAQSREVVLALDLSRSMDAADVLPSRLERAKLLIEGLLEELEGERVALVVFAGSAFLQSPLSADYEVLRELLGALTTDFLPQGGTDYGAMLRIALDGFSDRGGADRFVIVLSDGESHGEGWRARLPDLEERDVTILGLGIGTPEGALVPDGASGYVKDARGAAVLSRLEPATLEALSAATNGIYEPASAWVDLAALIEGSVARGQSGAFTEAKQVRRPEQFQWLLAPGIGFLLLCYGLELPGLPGRRRVAGARRMGTNQGRRFAEGRAGTAGVLLVAGVAALLGSVGAASISRAATSEGTPPVPGELQSAEESQNSLAALVEQMVDQSVLAPTDLARFAEESIRFAGGAGPEPDPDVIGGVVEDGLDAVDAGELRAPEAADWAALRRQLAALRPKPPESKPEQQPGEGESQEGKPEQGGGEEGERGGEDPSGESGEQGSEAEEGEGAEGERGESRSDAGSNSSEGGTPEQEPAPKQGDGSEMGPLDLDATEQGSEDANEDDGPEAEPEETAAAEPKRVGGGEAHDELARSRPDLASVLGELEKVRSSDSPGVLHLRMQRAAGEDGEQQPGAGEGRPW